MALTGCVTKTLKINQKEYLRKCTCHIVGAVIAFAYAGILCTNVLAFGRDSGRNPVATIRLLCGELMRKSSQVLIGVTASVAAMTGLYWNYLSDSSDLPGDQKQVIRPTSRWNSSQAREHFHEFRSLQPDKRRELIGKWKKRHQDR